MALGACREAVLGGGEAGCGVVFGRPERADLVFGAGRHRSRRSRSRSRCTAKVGHIMVNRNVRLPLKAEELFDVQAADPRYKGAMMSDIALALIASERPEGGGAHRGAT